MVRRAPLPPLDEIEWLDDIQHTQKETAARISQSAPTLNAEGIALSQPAPNAIEWIVGESWCNVPSLYKVSRQYQVIRDFFELRCPLCNNGGVEKGEPGDCWKRSRLYLESEILLVWNAEYQEDVCPRCRVTRSELLEDRLLQSYNQLHLLTGQRAGKSVCAGMIGTYTEHRLITIGLTHPGGLHTYFSTTKGDPLEVTFLASTDVQSQDTIWAKYTALRAESPWFKRFVPWVKQQEEMQVVPEGMKPWTYKETEKRITNQYPGMRLICNSLNSNAPGLRGRTRPAAFADEISHMNQTDSRQSAAEIYRALERSLRTVRSAVKREGGLPWLGLMASVTSPVSRKDKGWDLYVNADRVPSMYAKHYPTWEFNPYITRADLDEEFAKDPVGAERDYGANPPGAEHPLIHDEAKWKKLAIDFARVPTIEFDLYDYIDKTGQAYAAAKVKCCIFAMDRRPRYIAVDAGATFDQFAVTVGHAEYEETATGTRILSVIDGVCRILPRPGVEVRFQSIVDIVERLMQSMPIARVEFDRWQSIQVIQQIRDLGIFAEKHSLSGKDYVTFKIDCFEGLVRMLPPLEGEYKQNSDTFVWLKDPPQLSHQAAAIYELCGLQQDPDTGDVKNPGKGKRRGWDSNDVAQTYVHVHYLCSRQGFTDRHDDRSLRAARRRAEEGGRGWESRGGLARLPSSMAGRRRW
jgi:hypothetical protein